MHRSHPSSIPTSTPSTNRHYDPLPPNQPLITFSIASIPPQTWLSTSTPSPSLHSWSFCLCVALHRQPAIRSLPSNRLNGSTACPLSARIPGKSRKLISGVTKKSYKIVSSHHFHSPWLVTQLIPTNFLPVMPFGIRNRRTDIHRFYATDRTSCLSRSRESDCQLTVQSRMLHVYIRFGPSVYRHWDDLRHQYSDVGPFSNVHWTCAEKWLKEDLDIIVQEDWIWSWRFVLLHFLYIVLKWAMLWSCLAIGLRYIYL